MRHLTTIAVILAFLTGASTAIGQSGWYGGFSTGYPIGVAAHVGSHDLLGPGLGLRGGLRLASMSGADLTGFGVFASVDVLSSTAGFGTRSMNPYFGAGITLGLIGAASNSNANDVAGGMSYGAHGLAGARFGVSDTWAVFVEGGLGYSGLSAADSIGNTVTVGFPTVALRLGLDFAF